MTLVPRSRLRAQLCLLAVAASAIAVASLAAPEIAAAAGGTPAPDCGCGNVTQYTYNGPTSAATGWENYLVFTPDGYTGRQRVPLVVVTHGCNTTAAEQEGANNYDQLAEKFGFIIMYPDDNDNAHPVQCWQFYNQDSQRRGQGDVATIAGMTRAVMTIRNVDPQRVYEIGMSSGALITSDLAAAYPDLYAAIGIMAGGPFGNDTCLTGDTGAPSPGDPSQEASAAFAEEGPRARVMPFIVLNGDKDTTVSPGCDDQAVLQWLRTDNLVLSGQQTKPLSLTPSSDHAATRPSGYAYDVLSYTKPGGCLIGQHYVIHGMGHYWSGGTSNPAYSAYTDPKGPSASAASWAFFSHYTLRGTNGSCVTKPKANHKAKPNAKHRKAHRHSARPRHEVPRDPDYDGGNDAGGGS